jgi:hypothetical protein
MDSSHLSNAPEYAPADIHRIIETGSIDDWTKLLTAAARNATFQDRVTTLCQGLIEDDTASDALTARARTVLRHLEVGR